ncbi:hypothetical protein Syun_014587 [Stephania yunnanensis]|uniref:Uncharacterized protein n=1 Tax=Stephania yunnanensis TaxID=152371 RepID=A0AAP0JLZ3_9MAGN
MEPLLPTRLFSLSCSSPSRLRLQSSSLLCISLTPHPRASTPWSSSRRCLTLAPLLPSPPLGDALPSRLCSLIGELPGHPLASSPFAPRPLRRLTHWSSSPLRLWSLVILCSLDCTTLLPDRCSLIVFAFLHHAQLDETSKGKDDELEESFT